MKGLELWYRATVVGPDGTELVRCVLEGAGTPGLGTVDDVARLALWAGRLGGTVVVTEVSAFLGALLALAGLGVEVPGQAELGE